MIENNRGLLKIKSLITFGMSKDFSSERLEFIIICVYIL